ncbi:DUF7847 domain-containing protein [Halococcus saccharolyticus]|uniref:DUF7847 domain-containing protein n=1 Tax=Halococcus saccharolyticus DSM 5350 TaxID=1227455 RepID=M0MFS0_9EURY|nr:hypothetical protein [Halococcus saccharolyticus]EMA43280.1 hypothetical protein C449_14917 [Halococcus saccharolyticus DSM 5350]
MGAMSAGRQTVTAVARNPILIVVALVLGLVQVPQLLAQSANSTTLVVATGLLSLLFVLLYPFFFGGIIGMGNEAVEGKTSLGTFVSAGKANYVSLFGAFLILMGVAILYVVALLIVTTVGGVAVVSAGDALGGVAFLAIAGVALVAFLLYFLLFFFIQFFGQAIVLDDVGAVDGFKRSVGAVRGHKLSTLGYTLVLSLIGGVFGAFGALFALLQNPTPTDGLPALSPGAAIVAVAVFVVLSGVVGAFSMTYGVAFYRQIRPAVT